MANTLFDISATTDTISLIHKQDNRPFMEHVKYLKENTNNGWTKDRSMQMVGSIPPLEYVRICKINPELKDPNRLVKWLETWEGAAYRVAENGRHKCANIIIK